MTADAPDPATVQSVVETLAPMLNRKLWVCITDKTEGTSPAELFEHIPAHLEHQVALEKSGAMFAAGPLQSPGVPPGAKGLVIVRADSEEEARAIFDADPVHAAGVRDYELYEWTMNEGRISLSFDFSDQTARLE